MKLLDVIMFTLLAVLIAVLANCMIQNEIAGEGDKYTMKIGDLHRERLRRERIAREQQEEKDNRPIEVDQADASHAEGNSEASSSSASKPKSHTLRNYIIYRSITGKSRSHSGKH